MNSLFEKIIKTLKYYNKKYLILIRSIHFKLRGFYLSQPIFVVGCSRAGTTLVYKTLSESRFIGSLQKETHDFWAKLHPPSQRNWESHEIPEESACDKDRLYVSWYFYSQTGKKRIVDKNNQNGLSIPYLYKLFPDAHFVYIKRNPGDNINSLIQGWNKEDEFATWSNNLPEAVNIENGKNKRWCFFISKGWRDYCNAKIEEVCAFQYRTMNEAILDAKKKIPEEQWHEISYESLIAQPVLEFSKIFQGCGIPFDPHIKQHCINVLQRPYNTFSEIRIDKWKDGDNRKNIERVFPVIKDIIRRLNYLL